VTLTQDEAFARIRLLRSPNVGPVSYTQLLRRLGNAQAAIEALPDLASRGARLPLGAARANRGRSRRGAARRRALPVSRRFSARSTVRRRS
jgi:DNA processing protein